MNHTQSTAAAVCPQESSFTGNPTLDELVAELMPTSRWLAFLDGFLAGYRRGDGE